MRWVSSYSRGYGWLVSTIAERDSGVTQSVIGVYGPDSHAHGLDPRLAVVTPAKSGMSLPW
jgi:hypothetical protein